MWPRLAEHAHLIAIDLPGFGHSERKDELLTSSAMGEFVAHVIDAFGLKQPHAVGPDIGTSTLLFTAASHPGILRNRSNVAERLGFLSRLIHGLKPQVSFKDLKARVGEIADYVEAPDGRI